MRKCSASAWALLSVIGLSTAAAVAQEGRSDEGVDVERIFSVADEDGNDALSEREYEAVHLGKPFREAAGEDSRLDQDEFRREFDNLRQEAESAISEYDGDSDNRLSEQEYREANLQTDFQRADLTDDGQVSVEEFALAQGREQSSQPGSQQAGGSQSLEEIALEEPGQLEGTQVNDREGNKVGEISGIILKKEDKEFYALLSSGQILGLGGEDMAVPLKELQKQGDSIILSTEEAVVPFVAQDYLKVESAA